ncbi:MAG TPA: hypothetical protein VNK04_19770 [Gemmataceae bacterium]|nr:hypothetical protein [Gemmataceae bacterium]
MAGRGLVLALVTGLLAGCATAQPERTSSWLSRLRPLQLPGSANMVVMEVALIERPVGDPYINEELWDLADEQVIPLERKALVADNGFRVAQIAGMGPAGFRALLTSERSCANPRRIQRQAGDPTTLLLGLTMPRCRFRLVQDGRAEEVELEQALCTLLVVPTLTNDGRTRLRFTPQLRHGETALLPRPTADRSGTYSWALREHRPTEAYPNLSWEVTLAPNEYVVVGGRFDRPETLGHRFFVRSDEPNPVQRLLVIRTSRAAPGLADDGDSLSRSPPLALQAQLSGGKE